MKLPVAGFTFIGIVTFALASTVANSQDASFSGKVGRVWEDGFQLETGDRSIRVDSYDLCGDHTPRHLSVGEQVTVTGEFELREFDAFSITKADGAHVCK